jgi:hypothetical protein
MGGGMTLRANRDSAGPWETFTVTDHDDGTVSLRAFNGQYVAVFGGQLWATRDAIEAGSIFGLIDRGNGTVALRAPNGKYVWAGPGTEGLSASSDAIGAMETFHWVVFPASTRRIALRVNNGQYISAEGPAMWANRKTAGPSETFTVTDRGDGTVSLQAFNGRYVGVTDSGRRSLVANRDAFGPSEAFHLIDRGNGAIALQASHGQYVVAEMGGGSTLDANRNGIGPWETFQVVVPHESWMEGFYEEIRDKTLGELCLPGTHDSGTYELFMTIAPDAEDVIKELWEISKTAVGASVEIGPYIRSMAVAQKKSFYDQFRDGIRYIDLRICSVNDQFHTCHTLLGKLISTLMKDVKRFLDENRKEVIVFKVGFKSMDDEELRQKAWDEISDAVTPYFYRPANMRELLGKRFSDLVDADSQKRAIFLMPDVIDGIYSSRITTNAGVIQNLQERTASFRGRHKLLEAQFIRPISNDDFVRGFVQTNGCRVLPLLPFLTVLPKLGPVLAGLGLLAMPAYLLYVRNFEPKPTSLHQNARDSRSIIRDYFRWLALNPSITPHLLICDFFEEVPLVDIAIRISTGKPFEDLLNGVDDIAPTPPLGDRMVLLECVPSAVEATMKLALYSLFEIRTTFALLGGPFKVANPELDKLLVPVLRDQTMRLMNPRNW